MAQFTLFSNDNVILLQPNKPNLSTLKLTRPDCKISLLSSTDFSSTAFGPFDLSVHCHGIYGLIELLSGKYLIVITKQKLIGTLLNGDVYQIEGVRIVPCGVGVKGLSLNLQEDEEEFLDLLEEALNRSSSMAKGLYYSPTLQLNRSLQSQFIDPKSTPHQWKMEAIEEGDGFVVNSIHLKDFKEFKGNENEISKLSEFLCLCIQGFVEFRDFVVNEIKIDFALISRRNVSRTGVRYHCRGINSAGNVANFVETEQIVLTPSGQCGSFLQVRGSIPAFWRQNVRIKYKPELEIVGNSSLQESFEAHRMDCLKRYERVAVANLVDSKGGEAQLSKIFKKLSDSEESENWRYVEFDFHLECRNMAYENIEKLVLLLEKELEFYGYFEGNIKKTTGDSNYLYESENLIIKKKQNGVVRTNCMDCLDRTNVVQSVLAHRVLLCQLKDFEIISKSCKEFDNSCSLSKVFRNIWADNADAISTQYSGTGALKTDYTRTGKRSPLGAIQDGINSALRYYFGNFSDGRRQDSLNLLFGAYKIDSQNYKSPFKSLPVDPIYFIVKWLMIISILILVFLSFFKFNTKLSNSLFLLCVLIIFLLIQIIQTYGKRFVQKPRLSND